VKVNGDEEFEDFSSSSSVDIESSFWSFQNLRVFSSICGRTGRALVRTAFFLLLLQAKQPLTSFEGKGDQPKKSLL